MPAAPATLLLTAQGLAEQMVALAAFLRTAADDMEKDLTLPSESLSARIAAIMEEYNWLRAEALSLLSPSDGDPVAPEIPPDSLRPILEILQRLSNVEQCAPALARLTALTRLYHQELTPFPPFEPIHIEAARLCHLLQIGADAPERDALLTGTHPLLKLYRFIADGPDLNDEEWGALHSDISSTFGGAIVLAATRGRLAFPLSDPHEPERVVEENPPTTELVVEPEKKTETPLPPPSDPPRQALPQQEVPKVAEPPTPPTFPPEAPPNRPPELPPEVPPQPPIEQARPTVPAISLTDEPAVTAARLLEVGVSSDPELLNTLTWQLVRADRTALAAQIVGAATADHELDVGTPEEPLLQATVLATAVRYSDGALSKALREFYGRIASEEEGAEHNQARRLLAVAATLRPALLAPVSGAPDLLRELRLRDGFASLAQICSAVSAFGTQGVPLDPGALRAVQSDVTWCAAVNSVLQEATEWRARLPHYTISYQPAQRVLQRWLAPDGLIGELLGLLERNDPTQLPAIEAILTRYRDDSVLRREIDRTDRRVLQRRSGSDISLHALTQLMQRAREALDLAARWVTLQVEHTEGVNSYSAQQAQRLRGEVTLHFEAARQELERCRSSHIDGPMAVVAVLADVAVQSVAALFAPNASLPEGEPEPHHLLRADLITVPGLTLDDHWSPVGVTEPDLLEKLLTLAATDQQPWDRVLEAHLEQRDHEAARRLLQYLDSLPPEAVPSIPTLRQRADTHLADCRDALRNHIRQVQAEVESAVAHGLLREAERNDLVARVNGVEFALPQTMRFSLAHRQLTEVAEQIRSRRIGEVNAVRRRMESAGPFPPETLARLEAALAAGDALTANEYLDMVMAGQPLPEPTPTAGAVFADFWPERAAQIADAVERLSPKTLVRQIADQVGVPGLNMSQVPGAQARQGADMLEAWFAAKSSQRLTDELLGRILTGLGFEVKTAISRRVTRHTWFNIECRPLRDRSQCPVPQFGSSAGGRYRLLPVYDRPTEEDLINLVGDTTQTTPVLVLHFGRMTEKRRRDLARLCRERRKTFLLLDDVLMVYLCSVRGARLPVLFECTLPFTFLEPYTARAGLVPPELFYGRRAERDALRAADGSCFIYGGRQLGKTALLRDVARTVNHPESGHIAVYLDLKAEGIGHDRPVDDLWQLLATELKRATVLSPSTPASVGWAKLLDGIDTWLRSDPNRRILLLLDEADRFLESDGRDDFVRSARLKGIMDRTDRRFKVVFAGLHNVQRSTRRANHPLAHYGEALCIGPIMEEGGKEARALLERPLASLGYVFESADLVTRILSQTNYYPSLIQLYAQTLLRHMHSLPSGLELRTPPYIITARHVEEAYRNGELRKAIRDRFMWTLQLDERYELIAFAMAYQTWTEGAQAALIDGLSVGAIRAEAINWWPDGFRNVAEDSLGVILDEMVGLGVLRVTTPGHYALRSPNLVLLMGTEEDVSTQLLRSREAPPAYEPDTFRAAYRSGGTSDPTRRSPLTAEQESQLRQHRNGVTVVIGNEASGLSQLGEYLSGVFGETFTNQHGVMDRATFAARLDALSRPVDGVSLVYVPPHCPWSEVWVQEAHQHLNRLRSGRSFVRVVFGADPALTLQLLGEGGLEALRVHSVITLRPWHDAALRQWMDENNLVPSDPPMRERIRQITGLWPGLLQQIPPGTRGAHHHWDKSLDKLLIDRNSTASRPTWMAMLGLDQRQLVPVLSMLVQVGPATQNDLHDLLEPTAPDTLVHALRASELLHLVERTGLEWQVTDPVVTALLSPEQR